MVLSGLEGIALLLARILFGGVLAFTGLNHFMQTEQMAGYAQHKGLPAPTLSVLGSGALLVLGGLSIITGVLPVVGALVLAGFLVVSALTMHDFWAVPEDQQQTEMTQFLKNIALAGGALAISVLGSTPWALSLGIRLF
ncbi:DoxX family protein (plasmid) [Haloferax mediterranei ATCC 33500]|uniref:DoxX family protein n=1 Tax=Haloferax mediterranei (strain ATCC 33500 / DSM 1411 / JCM 8866 / NBRC 14739 / NCIMB 2177 / R-4) TaxID=523841 RepID=I3RBJ1_HALMT|nr:DoxX family protein [Haloferax mediterranei]AFK21601.1 terminal quinol oxidase subunit [Haloferax mediterranei ATCC 33500]AHZ24353.1 quinol oxidase [Haloferax mediterranei ATCC 33500]ELZ97088.1 terminal quinol oxidase subunit [Haloferax mediterranei ATCC 33500]MDX5990165.1 DoxX family protein [Haloferax mediterranei ATCC 33500]QCQ76760.1 DoxX family protein [Haloferax mediterranei ATCC 33500]